MAYVRNNPFLYPTLEQELITSNSRNSRSIPTGWQIIPTMLWRHFAKPKDWANLMIGYESYMVKGYKVTIFNPIPITSNLAIQRTNVFAAFNNCTYCNTYEDNFYETSWHPWIMGDGVQADTLNLMYKEGVFYKGTGAPGDANQTNYMTYKYYFPEYYWERQCSLTATTDVWSQGKVGSAGVFDVYQEASNPAQGMTQTPVPAGILWDPYERPELIGELRAGKNSCAFAWTPASCDEGKEFSLDRLAQYVTWTPAGPYCGGHRYQTATKYTDTDPERLVSYGKHVRDNVFITNQGNAWEDYTMPNWANCPIVPNCHFWHEIQTSTADYALKDAWKKIDKYWAGTESEQFRYPPKQCFIKGIPLWDQATSLIRTETQVSVMVELFLKCRKRRSAYYCPTFGPFSGEQLYGHTAHQQIFQENYIRYITGGTRRTWQNIIGVNNGNNQKVHPREDCYNPSSNFGDITSATYSQSRMPVPTAQGTAAGYSADNNKDSIVVTWSKDTDTTTIQMAPRTRFKLPKPKERSKSPSRLLDEQQAMELAESSTL